MENRCHWIVLLGLPLDNIGLANIYASNEPPLRYQLWKLMLHQLLNSVRWILAGDFNMVEAHQDKTNLCGRLISAGKRGIFSTLKCHLRLIEPPRSQDNLVFS